MVVTNEVAEVGVMAVEAMMMMTVKEIQKYMSNGEGLIAVQ